MANTNLKSSRLNSASAVTEAMPYISLEELLASCVVRQVMDRDGVDPQDVRKLITSIAKAKTGSQ